MSERRDAEERPPPGERLQAQDALGPELTTADGSTAFTRSQNALRTLLERCPFGVFVSDAVRVMYANPRLSEITGYGCDELLRIRSPIEVLIAPEDRDRLQVLAQRRLRGEAVEARYACRGLRRGGAVVWWELSMSLVRWEECPALLGIVQDIDARKRMEDELREAHGAWRALLDVSTEAAALCDPQGHLLAWNEAMMRSLGSPEQDLRGADVLSFLPPPVAARRRRWLQQVVRQRQPMHVVDEREDRAFEHRLYPILDEEGAVSQIAIYARGVTAQRAAEQAA